MPGGWQILARIRLNRSSVDPLDQGSHRGRSLSSSRPDFQSVLSIESDITVVGEAKTGAAAIALAREEAPDVVLMDIRMPEMDGLEATRLITSDPRLRRTRVVVLTTFDLDEYVFGALQAGASGFLLKGAEPPVLIEAVRTVARGRAAGTRSHPAADRSLRPSAARRPSAGRRAHASLLAHHPGAGDPRADRRGLTNSEIAARLYISPLTCKSHVSRILTKLDARDRTQLVVIAYESGPSCPACRMLRAVPPAE